jgi:hypothetical protein
MAPIETSHADNPPPPPARPRSLKVAFNRSGERLELRSRSGQWGGGCFLTLWLVGWTVGCVFLAGMVIREPRLFNFLFAIPFWVSWVFVFFLLIHMFFGREEFVLDHQGATFRSRSLVPLGAKFTPLSEIQSFDITTKIVDSESGRAQPLMEMQTLGQGRQFLQGVTLQELQWLRWQLTEHLALLKQAVAYATVGDEAEAETPTPPQLTPGESRPLELAASPIAAPSDSRWAYAEEIDEFRFVQSGRLSLAAIGGLLFVNLFWNGIVSVFASSLFGLAPNGPAPVGWEWWGLFFFLIPFEVIGLVMFVGLLAAVFDPVRRNSWTFTRQSIECRWKWLGVGPRWVYEIERLARIEMRRDDPSVKQTVRGALRNSGSGGGDMGAAYRLLFIDRANCELCSIDGLTEGEARWIGDTVLRNRDAWF